MVVRDNPVASATAVTPPQPASRASAAAHCWGNMAAYPVVHQGKAFRTTEALFQSLRFDDEEVVEAIRAEKSPMAAKFVAKKHKAKMVVEPLSDEDLENMRLCLRLKLEQHPELTKALLETGGVKSWGFDDGVTEDDERTLRDRFDSIIRLAKKGKAVILNGKAPSGNFASEAIRQAEKAVGAITRASECWKGR